MGIALYDRPVTLEELELSVPYVGAEAVLDTYSGPFAAVVGVYAGIIFDIMIDWDSVNPHINPGAPVAPSIPLNKGVRLNVWAKNTGTEAVKFRIEWTVKRPDGTVAETYADTQLLTTGVGSTHKFIGGGITVNMAGSWTMTITLKRIY